MKILRNITHFFLGGGAAAARTRVGTQRKIEILWYAHDIKVPSSLFLLLLFVRSNHKGRQKSFKMPTQCDCGQKERPPTWWWNHFLILSTGNQQQKTFLLASPQHQPTHPFLLTRQDWTRSLKKNNPSRIKKKNFFSLLKQQNPNE